MPKAAASDIRLAAIDPPARSCRLADFPTRGQLSLVSIHVQSRQEQLSRRSDCGRPFPLGATYRSTAEGIMIGRSRLIMTTVPRGVTLVPEVHLFGAVWGNTRGRPGEIPFKSSLGACVLLGRATGWTKRRAHAPVS
jgi:hypothetical protein